MAALRRSEVAFLGPRRPVTPALLEAAEKSWQDVDVTAAIVVVLTLLGVGIVIDQLFRLRNWLNTPPPRPDDHDTPDGK